MRQIRQSLVLLSLVALTPLNACSAHHERSVSSVEVSDPGTYDSPRVERTETTKVEEHDDRGHGLFSILGDIVALPFRAVGGLFSAIFS